MEAFNQAVVKEMKEGQATKKRYEPLCAVQICFHNTKHIDEVVEQLKPIVGQFERYGKTLFQMCENRNEAQTVANTINSIVYRTNKILISTPFKSNWLEEYYQNQSYGIDVAFANSEVKSAEKIEKYLSKKAKKKAEEAKDEANIYYKHHEALAKQNALTITKNDIVEGWAKFICANWETNITVEQVTNMFNSLYGNVAAIVKDRDFLPNNPCFRLLNAIEDKSKNLTEEKELNDGKSQDIEVVSAAILRVREKCKIEQVVNSRTKANQKTLNDIMSTCRGFFETHLEEYKDKFTVKDNVLKTDLEIPNYIYRHYKSPKKLLGSHFVNNVYVDESPLDKPLYRICEMFSEYLYTLGQFKHEEGLRKALVELSYKLDETSYHDAILKIMDNTQPY